MALLKYLCNFWITLDNPLINCEINPILIWSAKCVLFNANANKATTLAITDTQFYVPVLTLSTKHNAKYLQQLQSGFNWNKYQSQITTQAVNQY